MKFSYTMQNRLKDISTDGSLKLSALLEAVENAGAAHTEFVKDTPADGSADGVAQIVTDWTIRFLKQPQAGLPHQVMTWVEKERPGYVIHRQAQILDGDGTPSVLLRACVSLFDRKEQKIVRGMPGKLALYEPEEETAVKGKRKLFSMDPGKAAVQKQIRLRNTDFDYNGHLHNTAALDLAAEMMSDEEIATLQQLQIRYEKQIPAGNRDIQLLRFNTQDGMLIEILQDGEVMILLETQYSKQGSWQG